MYVDFFSVTFVIHVLKNILQNMQIFSETECQFEPCLAWVIIRVCTCKIMTNMAAVIKLKVK